MFLARNQDYKCGVASHVFQFLIVHRYNFRVVVSRLVLQLSFCIFLLFKVEMGHKRKRRNGKVVDVSPAAVPPSVASTRDRDSIVSGPLAPPPVMPSMRCSERQKFVKRLQLHCRDDIESLSAFCLCLVAFVLFLYISLGRYGRDDVLSDICDWY